MPPRLPSSLGVPVPISGTQPVHEDRDRAERTHLRLLARWTSESVGWEARGARGGGRAATAMAATTVVAMAVAKERRQRQQLKRGRWQEGERQRGGVAVAVVGGARGGAVAHRVAARRGTSSGSTSSCSASGVGARGVERRVPSRRPCCARRRRSCRCWWPRPRGYASLLCLRPAAAVQQLARRVRTFWLFLVSPSEG